MKPPKIANELIHRNSSGLNTKPAWQRHLYARLAERAGAEGKISYGDRDASKKNPTRKQIQVWYEQIYSELAQAYDELHKEHEMLKTEVGALHRTINNRDDMLHESEERFREQDAQRQALVALITRAHTAEARVEDYVRMYGQS